MNQLHDSMRLIRDLLPRWSCGSFYIIATSKTTALIYRQLLKEKNNSLSEDWKSKSEELFKHKWNQLGLRGLSFLFLHQVLENGLWRGVIYEWWFHVRAGLISLSCKLQLFRCLLKSRVGHSIRFCFSSESSEPSLHNLIIFHQDHPSADLHTHT